MSRLFGLSVSVGLDLFVVPANDAKPSVGMSASARLPTHS